MTLPFQSFNLGHYNPNPLIEYASEPLPPYQILCPPPYLAPPDEQDDLEIILSDDSCSSTSVHSSSINLQRQLEYYFSRQNLVSDIYLVSQMDADLYVPIATIAGFNRVKQYTTDLDTIVHALRQSPALLVNDEGTKVKPNISTERTTVILRELPDNTSEEEISQLLRDINSPPVKGIKRDVGNLWYIAFESEKDALRLLCDVRGRIFQGKPVAARMKSMPAITNILESVSLRKQQQQQQQEQQPSTHVDRKNPIRKKSRKRAGNKRKKDHVNKKKILEENNFPPLPNNTTGTTPQPVQTQQLPAMSYAAIAKKQ
ncbi:hypothetical protein BJV82DRAFT_597516 [Fennellomyces sp. T-0311]|nr:hypothetical protein BJV82DRAFT_597516 [Fennellomyces sp. T-0311]